MLVHQELDQVDEEMNATRAGQPNLFEDGLGASLVGRTAEEEQRGEDSVIAYERRDTVSDDDLWRVDGGRNDPPDGASGLDRLRSVRGRSLASVTLPGRSEADGNLIALDRGGGYLDRLPWAFATSSAATLAIFAFLRRGLVDDESGCRGNRWSFVALLIARSARGEFGGNRRDGCFLRPGAPSGHRKVVDDLVPDLGGRSG